MAAQNLPMKAPATVEEIFINPEVKKRLQMAVPRHLTADKLLRVAASTIRHNPTLSKCTPMSLLAAIMGCAILGLEPEPFLGQAYLVPFWNSKLNSYEAQLIPGYRGYIALARRTGEVQSVSVQIVHEHDAFMLRFGLNETLDHTPGDEDERGEAKGAYVIFKYKDGSHSFDYMSKNDINKIMDRTKSRDRSGNIVGPWITDWDEMAKKTVIRRHVKVVPLSVEIVKAASMEDAAMAGQSQVDFVFPDALPEVDPEEINRRFDEIINREFTIEADINDFKKFFEASAKGNKLSILEAKVEALQDMDGLLQAFLARQAEAKKKNEKHTRSTKPPELPPEEGTNTEQKKLIACPRPEHNGDMMEPEYCLSNTCGFFAKCPMWTNERAA